ncbi:Txe/YoeB family addiction module toxin [Amphritea pacifica]|uniref:Putative mRNA interferase YoeB n=1 Tax=Amphritea pacifica TaxID=2811233 RepID=A0ABS2W7K3_9GAMM|nr:Txe/YoeB family addiction module toxin [Amphritea pacifica]MBN0987611.1 Txe/YoeB family addiction module toxin [Amphritea pacifica]MBN1007456.1 Txe/YoeB family addiction module toxin [Amphritea pacifica]
MARKLSWANEAWDDYLYWQKNDPKILARINELIKASMRTPFTGIGKPERLKGDLSGFVSRRINQEHRLIYTVDNDTILIAQCRYHY